MQFLDAVEVDNPPQTKSTSNTDLKHCADSGTQLSVSALQNLIIGFRTVLDQTGTYIFTKNTAGVYTYVNQKVEELFGETLENIVGKDDTYFFDLALTDDLRQNDRLVIDEGKIIEKEEQNIIKATGETRYYWTIKKPLFDDSGQIIGMCGISTDITERKVMENALRINESHLRLSQACGGIGTWEADFTTNKQTWSESCVALLGFPSLSSPSWDDFLEAVHPEDRENVLAAIRAHIENSTKYDVEYRITYNNGDIRWMRSVGELEKSLDGKPLVMRGIVQDVTDRKLAQLELEQSLSLLVTTIESTQDAVLVVDLTGKWTLHNKRFLDLWNITPELIESGDDYTALTYVLSQLEDAENFHSKVMELYTTPDSNSFDIVNFKNGKVVERYSKPQRINGVIVGRVWSFRDITEHVQAKQALKREAEKNLAILRNASDGIHILDYDGNILEVSDSFCSMLGYQREELIGMHVSKWDAEFIGDELLNVVRRQFENPIRSEFETRHRRKDGTIFNVEVSGYPLELDGHPVLFNSARDITQRMHVEESLRLKERYQRALLDNFPFAVWLKDTNSRLLAVNTEFANVFGFNSSSDLIGKNDFDIAPAELAEKYQYDDLRVLDTRQNMNIEELIFTDGEYRWFETYKAPVIDVNLELLGTVGFARDITERKQSEESLHLAASVFTYAREGIMITKANGEIVNVNEAFTRITGYSRDEIVGQNPQILSSGQQSQEFYRNLWQGLADNGYWQGEIWNRRKDGEVFAELLTISAVRDINGRTLNYVALFTDITPQKEHEYQLEHIAHFDALTNLPNRVLLADRLHLAMNQTLWRGEFLAVVYLDLDGFKDINDNHGHATGDQLLMIIANRMKEAMRDGDTLARLGGDEFVAVLVDINNSAGCVPMVRRLLESASEPILIGSTKLRVSASLGITFYPQDLEVDADQLLRQADQAMYQAKLSGKNRFHIFDARQDSSIRTYHENLEQIRIALAKQEFVLYFPSQG